MTYLFAAMTLIAMLLIALYGILEFWRAETEPDDDPSKPPRGN